jgi:lipopolysaccharide export system protein LptA
MKKLFWLVTVLMLLLAPALCLAAKPQVTADQTSFNPLNGVYTLDGNVTVRLPEQTITAEHATVNIYKLTCEANGNVHLTDTQVSFTCDSVSVVGRDSIAYCSGNCTFQEGVTRITSNTGSFNWDSKLATFSGNVLVNGTAKADGTTYNVINQSFQ